MNAFLADKPPSLHAGFRRALEEGEGNAVLNYDKVGVEALQVGEFGSAEYAFDQSLLRIEAIYANNDNAKKARSIWHKESRKDFKGEPYERAMAFCYRGLLYLRAADYQNARACFKSAQLQDAFAEDQQAQCDFALMYFLEGWASQCDGDLNLANEAFTEVKRIRPEFVAPDPADNVLFMVETGSAPVKRAEGKQQEILTYYQGQEVKLAGMTADCGSGTASGQFLESVFFQATTRGGRPIDQILKNHAVAKSATNTAGNVALAAGAATMIAGGFTDSSEAMIAGAGIAAAGLIAKGVSSMMKAEADARCWDNLPDAVWCITAKCENPDTKSATVRFTAPEGAAAPADATVPLLADTKGKAIAWLRIR
jgi:tetratricopeptide (TPR) repeat protein